MKGLADSGFSGDVMEKVVEYFHYWYRYRNSDDVPDMPIPVELSLELLVAADFMGLDGMLSHAGIGGLGLLVDQSLLT